MPDEKTTKDETPQSQGTQDAGEREAASLVSRIRAALSVDGNADPVEAITSLHRELERLSPLAEDGKKYRADLIDDAVASRARLRGADGFAEGTEERYRKLLANADIETIRQMRDDDEAAIAARGLFSPGRKTKDDDEAPIEDRGSRLDDPASYRA